MLKRISFIILIGALAIGSVPQVMASTTTPSLQLQNNTKTLGLKDLLTTQDDMPTLGASAGRLTMDASPDAGGTIRFLKAYFYSDAGCTTLLGAGSIIDNGTGFPFTNGQTVSLNASSAYQLANNQGIATGSIACMKLYVDGSNEKPNGVSCQAYNDETCTGGSCTSNTIIDPATWTASSFPATCGQRYAYIANTTTSINSYAVNPSNGNLSLSTSTALPFLNPIGIAVNNGHAYITYLNSGSVTVANVNAATGGLTIINTTNPNPSSTSFAGIALNTGYAYLTNTNNSNVTKCTIDAANGTFVPGSCVDTAISGLTGRGIAVNNGYAYIVSNANNRVFTCTVDASTGALSSCVTSVSIGLTAPTGIALNNGFAYITNSNTTVMKCTIGAAGSLTSCVNTSLAPSGSFRYIAIKNGFAYLSIEGVSLLFPPNNNLISKCAVDANTGALSGCALGATNTNRAQGLAIF